MLGNNNLNTIAETKSKLVIFKILDSYENNEQKCNNTKKFEM